MSPAAGKVAHAGSGFVRRGSGKTSLKKKVAQCSDKQERFANSPCQRAFVYLDLPSVARRASDWFHPGLGKVSGWMIWITSHKNIPAIFSVSSQHYLWDLGVP